jgi:aminoglycoside phosphotransferase (APT) family kinase protein
MTGESGASGPATDRLSVSTRDDEELRDRLSAWLATRPELGSGVRIDAFERPEANGMSSETLLFDASWMRPGGERSANRFVARLAPTSDAFPVFPSYDLERQVRVMRLVGERTTAPVPQVHWYEPDPAPLGTPFFVMDRVDGLVPPDVMPYPFDDTWVSKATPAQRARLQSRTVDVLAAIHGVEAAPSELDLLFCDQPRPGIRDVAGHRTEEESPLRRHFADERSYYDWVRGDLRFPILERAFEWLETHWPTESDAPDNQVLCWGDARIGNVLYQDFEPVGVLDWEMATIGPRELDLGWFVFLHRFFDDITTEMGMAGLPDFLDRHDVAAQYAERTGHRPRDLDWFITYAGLRHGTVMIRALGRRVHLGEQPMPDDPQDLVMHRRGLERLLDGTYYT